MGTRRRTQTLIQWMIQKLDTNAYRAGRLNGWVHPNADQRMIDAVGGLSALVAQAGELEKDEAFRGKLRVKWISMNRDLEKIEFSAEIMEELCRREGIPDPRKRQLDCLEQVKELKQLADTDWINPFYDRILERLEAGELVRNVNQDRGPGLDDRAYFLCLNGAVDNQKPIWKRVFSAAIFRDLPPVTDTESLRIPPSKCFEKKYQKRIFNVLKDHSPFYKEGMTENELLAAHGILSYAQTLEWKGPLQYQIEEGTVLDTCGLKYGTVLNAQTLEHAVPLRLPGVRRIMTIENKANYESMAYTEDTLYIFCHGFFSPKERRFLAHLTEIAERDMEYLHWGDMDYGGICIFKFIQEELFSGLKPYRMGREEFERALDIGSGMELRPEKRQKYEGLKVPQLEELKQCILRENMEIEQELLLVEEYKKDTISGWNGSCSMRSDIRPCP